MTPPYPPEKLAIYNVDIQREQLYERCNLRFVKMLENGAYEEVNTFMKLTVPPLAPILKTLGLQQITAYLRKEMPLEEAIKDAQQATRNYAKRQLTWFRNQIPHKQLVAPGENLSKNFNN